MISTRLGWLAWPVLALVAMVAAGCQTTPRIDWAARVGVYTYDQAVLDFGPPDRSAKLADDSVVAEWVLRRGHSRSYVAPANSLGYGYSAPGLLITESYSPEFVRRLTFGPDGKLRAWKSLAK